MSWQDIVLSLTAFIFTIALIPTILDKEKPALTTSLTNGIVLVIVAATLATLSLWVAAAVDIATAALWFILAIQRAGHQKKRRQQSQPT